MKQLFFLCGIFFCTILHAQRHTDTIWKHEINRVFENVDISKLRTGLLLDYALEFTNVEAYNGTITDSTDVNITAYSNIYKTLFMAKANTDTTYMPTMEVVAKRWYKHRLDLNPDEDGVIVLSGLFFEYNKISPDAISRRLITVDDNKYYTSGSPEAFIEGKTVAFAPPLANLNSLDFWVTLPKDMFLSNLPQDNLQIEIDFNDGNGYQYITFGQQVHVVYTAEGQYRWKYRLKFNGSVFEASSLQFVADLNPFKFPFFKSDGAKLRIKYAPAHNGKIMKPLIVAEGFDTGSVTSPEKPGGDRSIDKFLSSVFFTSNSGELANILTNNQQYDIIYIDWKNGMDDIKENSKVLVKILNYVNAQKELNGSSEPNVLLGQSMGGLIGRYTLAKMEKDRMANPSLRPHDVRLFIAHDSPMQGANTPLSFQYFTRHIYDEYVTSPVLYYLAEVEVPKMLNFTELMSWGLIDVNFPTITDVLTLQDTPAALQMNYLYVDKDSNPTGAVHQLWQNEFDTMGYPQQSKNVAISNGHECAPNHGFNAMDTFIGLHDMHNPGFFGDIINDMITPTLGVLLSDIKLMILGLLPGSTRYDFDFDLRANPEVGATNRKVYNGKVRYTKKLFGLIPLHHTLFEREKTVPNGAEYLPYDTYSGGYYNIAATLGEDYLDKLPVNTLKIERYGFIPVVSALDIKRNGNSVNNTDYRLGYNTGNMPDTALSSGFDSYIVGYTQGSVPNNYPHISFQARNGNWLAAELNGLPSPPSDCGMLCGPKIIAGPDIVCYSGTYTAPDGFTGYNWYISPAGAGTIVSGQGTKTVTVTFGTGYNGSVSITASLSLEGCGTTSGTKNTWIGPPSGPVFISGQAKALTGAIVGYTTYAPGATYYEWSLPGGGHKVEYWLLNAPYWQMLIDDCNGSALPAYTGTGGQTGWVTATGCNICGCGDTAYFEVRSNDDNGTGITPHPEIPSEILMYTVSPNPADTNVEITLRNPGVSPAPGTAVSARFYDFYGNMLQDITITNNRGNVNVSTFPTGVYTLQVYMDGNVESHQVLVVR